VAKLTIELGATIGKLKRGLANARAELKGWSQRVAKLGKVGLAVGAGALAAGLATLTKRAVELAAKFQQTQVAFNAMLGDSQKAASLIEALTEFSTKTPFSPEKVQQAAKTLLSFGFTAEEVKKTLKPLGDVAAGTGKDFQELAVIFGQIKSAGRLMGQDLLQLINAGFNPLQVMSEKTGKSVTQLKDDMSKGLITFDMVEQAFIDATSAGGLFNDMMAKQSETLIGKVSTLKGNFDELLKTLGSGSTGFLADLVEQLNEATKGFQEMATAMEAANSSGIDTGMGFDFRNLVARLIEVNAATGNPLAKSMLPYAGELREAVLRKQGIELGGPSEAEIESARLGRTPTEPLAGNDITERLEKEAKLRDELNGEIADWITDLEAEHNKTLREIAQDNSILEQQARAAREFARDSLREGIAMNEKRASELEASIAQAFRPQGEIASGLARIGGERGITLARNVPERQLSELQAIRKGIDVMKDALQQIDTTPAWPGGR